MEKFNQEFKASVLKLHLKNSKGCIGFDMEKKEMFNLLQANHDGVLLFDTYLDEYKLLHWEHADNHLFGSDLKDFDSFHKLVHPDDRHYVISGKINALRLREKKKNENILHCKLMYECNLKNKHGIYRRFHLQYRTLELDEAGDIRLVLILLNEIGAYDPEIRARGMSVLNLKIGEYHPLDTETCLSEAEIRVLKLLAKGMVSKEVAVHLVNSKSTIDNHRCKILEKLQAYNIAHAINYAHIMEII